MKNYPVVKIVFGLLLSSLGCVDEIRLSDAEQPETGILVQGRLIQGNPTTVSLVISELYAFEKNLPRAIVAKSVLLIDDNGHSIKIHSNGDGTYEELIAVDNPDFPIQWFRALGYLLALDLAPEYGVPIGDLAALAQEAIMIATKRKVPIV